MLPGRAPRDRRRLTGVSHCAAYRAAIFLGGAMIGAVEEERSQPPTTGEPGRGAAGCGPTKPAGTHDRFRNQAPVGPTHTGAAQCPAFWHNVVGETAGLVIVGCLGGSCGPP